MANTAFFSSRSTRRPTGVSYHRSEEAASPSKREEASEGIADDRVEVGVSLELAELGAPGAAEEVDAEGGPQGVRHVVLHLGIHVEVPLVGASEDEQADPQRLVPEEPGEP